MKACFLIGVHRRSSAAILSNHRIQDVEIQDVERLAAELEPPATRSFCGNHSRYPYHGSWNETRASLSSTSGSKLHRTSFPLREFITASRVTVGSSWVLSIDRWESLSNRSSTNR
jgi:hypothetical protein